MRLKNKIAAVLFTSALAIAFGISCKKEDPTRVTVTVQDSVGLVVPGAFVRVYSKPSDTTRQVDETRFDETKVTNGNGQVMFDYSDFTKPGQAGFAVLDIEAYKFVTDTANPQDTTELYGIGQVRVEEEKNNTKTIRIQ
ncbi:MAG: hypothetical protein ACPF8V_03095 [Luteibaculum sp.]